MRARSRVVPLLMALALCSTIPAVSTAQRGLGGLRGRGAGLMAAAQDASLLGVILTHKDDLKLSAEQVATMRRIDSTTTAANAPTMAKMRALRGDSTTSARPSPGLMTQEQRAMAVQKLQEAAPLLREIGERNAKAADDARALLSQEQKDALQKILDEIAIGRGRGRRPGR